MESRVAVVLGGTGGIGFSICKNLFTENWKVYLVGRDKERAKKAALKIEKSCTKVLPEKANVLKEEDLESLFVKIKNRESRIDVIINSTGVFEPFGQFEKVKIKSHLKPFQVNLFGSFNMVHAALPILIKQKFGKIILFSGGGVGGDMPLVNAASYFTSKAAVSVFVEVLAKELESENIQINAILPSQILTKSTKKTFKISKDKLGPVLAPATQSLRETGGNSLEKVLQLINFLVADASNHISGRTLSAKWDDLDILKKGINDERFKLRRIDGKIYRKTRV